MKLKKCSASKLKRLSRHKKIICFGAGERFYQIFNAFLDMHIEENIAFIVDNDERKWGTYRELNGKKIEIKSPQVLKNISSREYVILITAMRYNEIFAQIQNWVGNESVFCIKEITYRNQIAFWFEYFAKIVPLQNAIVFQGEGDTYENSNSLCNYLKTNGYLKKYRFYWLCNHPELFVNTSREKYIKRDANLARVSYRHLFLYIVALNNSKYLIFENQMIKKRREDQISIYLNHGSPPLKATKGIINLPNNLNYAVCPSVNCADILSEQYGINRERLLYSGSPRTDILFDDAIHAKLSARLSSTEYKKVILWVPTFRQHYRSGRVDTDMIFAYGIPVIKKEEDWVALIEYLKKNNILLIIKPHLLQKLDLLNVPTNNNITFIKQDELETYEANVYDLMKLCDGMISDYSTIAFDYMLLDRPIGYTIDDMDDYKVGFSVDNPLDYMPGKKIKEIHELVEFVDEVLHEEDVYREKRDVINRFVHGEFIDGENSRRLVECLKL